MMMSMVGRLQFARAHTYCIFSRRGGAPHNNRGRQKCEAFLFVDADPGTVRNIRLLALGVHMEPTTDQPWLPLKSNSAQLSLFHTVEWEILKALRPEA